MKTKLYRTITLVLAIVMLLGVTPAFAASLNPKQDISYWENHEYVTAPYDYNISADPNKYIPFSSVWEYGDRTSASSKGWCWELEDGICYVTKGALNAIDYTKEKGINLSLTANMETGYFEGNTHIETAIFTGGGGHGALFQGATNLKLAIILKGSWMAWDSYDWKTLETAPTFPHNVTVIGGLLDGEMYIANSNSSKARTVFKDRNEFIEAVRPILASAHLNAKAWSLLPAELGGQTEVDPLRFEIVSDWARDEFLKAMNVGVYPQSIRTMSIYSKLDARKMAPMDVVAEIITSTYEAICKTNNTPTSYPATIPETFGPNNTTLPANKCAVLGILKGNGETWVYNGVTYANYSGLVTREQMAAILTRLAKACGKTLPTGTMPFTDTMSDWAKPEVSACYNAGMIKGTSATTFGAYDKVTIEQAVILCYRAYVYLTNH